MDRWTRIGGAGQWISAILSCVGIGIEIAMRAHAGFLLITLGAVIFGFSTKVKYHNK